MACGGGAENAWAAEPGANTGTASECPVTIKAGDQTLNAVQTATTMTTQYNGTASVFEVAVTLDTKRITVSNQKENFLAYNYDEKQQYLAGNYENDGTIGVSTADIAVDSNGDHVDDYIWIQKPYVKK